MNVRKILSFTLTTAITGIFISALMSGPVLAKKKLPEVDSDGLHLVKHSKVAVAYMKPGTDLGKYNKVKLLDCYVAFVKNWQREYNMGQVGLDGRVTDKDAEKIKTRLAAEFTKVFTKELTKKGFPIVDAAGADVLILRPALINVDVTSPDIPTADDILRHWAGLLAKHLGSVTEKDGGP